MTMKIHQIDLPPKLLPGWSNIAFGALTVGGAIIFSSFAAVPATALGGLVLAAEVIGVSVGGTQIVMGALTFTGSEKQAHSVSQAYSNIPTGAVQFLS